MSSEPNQIAFGLKPSVVIQMNAVFAAFPQVEQAILYGPRAKGNFRDGSDIDLCLIGDTLTMAILLKIENALDDLLLPYKIGLSLHHHLDNAELLTHILRVGVIFYQRDDDQKH